MGHGLLFKCSYKWLFVAVLLVFLFLNQWHGHKDNLIWEWHLISCWRKCLTVKSGEKVYIQKQRVRYNNHKMWQWLNRFCVGQFECAMSSSVVWIGVKYGLHLITIYTNHPPKMYKKQVFGFPIYQEVTTWYIQEQRTTF